MDEQKWQSQEALRQEVGGFPRWKLGIGDDNNVGFGVVLGPWCESEFTSWVRA